VCEFRLVYPIGDETHTLCYQMDADGDIYELSTVGGGQDVYSSQWVNSYKGGLSGGSYYDGVPEAHHEYALGTPLYTTPETFNTVIQEDAMITFDNTQEYLTATWIGLIIAAYVLGVVAPVIAMNLFNFFNDSKDPHLKYLVGASADGILGGWFAILFLVLLGGVALINIPAVVFGGLGLLGLIFGFRELVRTIKKINAKSPKN